MSFDQREEFFLPGTSAQVLRGDAWQALILRGLMGIFFGSMWFWMEPGDASSDQNSIYLGVYMISPLIGLGIIISGIVRAFQKFREAKQPVVDKLAYALDPQGIHLLFSGAPALMPWATLRNIAPNPKIPSQLLLVHRPVGGKADEQRVVIGEAQSRDGEPLAARLPLWHAALSTGAGI